MLYVVRRRFPDEPMSRLAMWSRRLAVFAIAVALLAIVIANLGFLEPVPAVATLGGGLFFAFAAMLLALGAFAVIWQTGRRGLGLAVTALAIGFAMLAYPGYLMVRYYQLPAIADITTDPSDPPRFEVIGRVRPRGANPIAYAGPATAELQRLGYPDLEPLQISATPQEAYDAAMAVITKRKWRVVDARPPAAERPDARAPAAESGEGRRPRAEGRAGRAARAESGNRRAPEAAPREGRIEAVARTTIMGFRDDVVVRVRPDEEGARVDVRSASRYGVHDFGANASRVRALLEDIEDVAGAEKTRKQLAKPKAPPAQKKGAQAPARR